MLGCSSKSYSFVFFGSIVLLVQAFFGNDGIGGGGDVEAGRSSPGGVGVGSGLRQLWGLKNRGASNTEGAAHIQTVDVIFEKNMLLRMLHRKSAQKKEVDATTSARLERGKLISHRVTGAELYKAYNEIKEEYRSKAMSKSFQKKWKVLKEGDGIEISMLQHPQDPSCPYVRMVADMPGSIDHVWEFLELDNWEETMPKMDPFYAGLTVLGKYSHRPMPGRPAVSMVLAKKKTKRIVTFGKRDFTFVSVSDIPRADGVWVSGTVSVVTPKFPRDKNYVRAFQDSVAFYETLPDDPRTGEPRSHLTIVCRIDLNDSSEGGDGGAIPMWIYVKTIGQSGFYSIANMRTELRKRLKIKLAAKDGNVFKPVKALDETVIPLVPWLGL